MTSQERKTIEEFFKKKFEKKEKSSSLELELDSKKEDEQKEIQLRQDKCHC